MIYFRKIKWYIEDHIFLLKMWFYDYLVDPLRTWYSDHFVWKDKWVQGYYTIDEDDKSKNYWLSWIDDDTYVTPNDSYFEKFKDFKNGTKFRCHMVWNSRRNRPQKIKDIEILRKSKKESKNGESQKESIENSQEVC